MQSKYSVKYIFKYINKNSDRIFIAIVPTTNSTISDDTNIDEIKQYLDSRYIIPSEAWWRMFSYLIHGRKPTVERLFFYIEGENSMYYKDYAQIENVLLKLSVTESMFTSLLVTNREFEEANIFTYG